MPRPHYPASGGARMPYVNHRAAPGPGAGDCAGCRELTAEVARLRGELSRNQKSGGPGFLGTSLPMVWAALGVCGVGLLFALLALVRHG